MTRLAMLIVLLLAPAAGAGPIPPARPKVSWIKARPQLVALAEGHAALPDAISLTPGDDGELFFGVTGGFDVAVDIEKGELRLTPHGRMKPRVLTKTTVIKLPFRYGNKTVKVPVRFSSDAGTWSYRVAALLRIKTPVGHLFLRDDDGDGWFDDPRDDRAAVSQSAKAVDLSFAPYSGRMQHGKTFLVFANPARALLWPVSAGVPEDYVRHCAEVNARRRFAGLDPVGLAEELTPLCVKHSNYCTRHSLVHAQDKSSPLYSAEGHYAGMHGIPSFSDDAGRAVRKSLLTLWHRNYYYVPRLTRLGVGRGGKVCTSDVLTYGGSAKNRGGVILVPPDGALDAPVVGGPESPSPYPSGRLAGPFVSVLLPVGKKELLASATLTSRAGAKVAFVSTDPARPPGPAASRFPNNDWTITLIPRAALEAETIYDVVIVARSGQRWSWSFRTGKQQGYGGRR